MARYANVDPSEDKDEVQQLVPITLSEPQPASLWSSRGCFGSGVCGIKVIILGSVVIQNTAYALVRRYSRGSLQEKYSASSVLLVMEMAKLALSAVQERCTGRSHRIADPHTLP